MMRINETTKKVSNRRKERGGRKEGSDKEED